MGSSPDQPFLVVIVGQTASGKSALALELAQRFNGEIIAADSRTTYRELDIGTAKPSLAERQLVPHHLLDVAAPNEFFTAADFKRAAQRSIQDIAARGRLPFLVGGTGLYIDAVLYDFGFGAKADRTLRAALQKYSVEELQTLLLQKAIPLPLNERNPRHLIRSLETKGSIPQRSILRPNTLILGLEIDRGALQMRIQKRVHQMIKQGVIEEVKQAAAIYGWNAPALQSTSYKALRPYLAGTISLDEATSLFIRNDLHLAKRQRTWFKRNKSIHWICKKDQAVALITTFLNK